MAAPDAAADDGRPGLRVGLTRPPWKDDRDRRVCGWDEDALTLTAGAALLVTRDGDEVRAVTVVTRTPAFLEDDAGAVLACALDLPDTVPIRHVLGGGPDVLECTAAAGSGDLVVAVDTDRHPGAAALLVLDPAVVPTVAARHRHSLPLRVRPTGSGQAITYDDPRLLRERGWRPLLDALAAPGSLVTGIPDAVARRFAEVEPFDALEDPEAGWAPLAAIAHLGGRAGRVLAVEGASAVAATIPAGVVDVRRRTPPARVAAVERVPSAGRIPLSLAAYERAFDAKAGLVASRCACGELHYPPRSFCSACGQVADGTPVTLPRGGSAYSVVTVRVPVPGMPAAYSLVLVELDGVGVRVLAHVTDAEPGSVLIGARGELVLRRVAEREGVSDYGYAFRPQGSAA